MIDRVVYEFVGALVEIGEGDNQVDIPSASGDSVLNTVLNLVYFFFGIVAVISIILSAFMYVTSNGDSGQVKKAKDGILYSVIGLIITLIAFTVTWFIIGRF